MIYPNKTRTRLKIRLAFLASLMLLACGAAHSADDSAAKAHAKGPAVWTLSDEDTTVHLFGLAQVLLPHTDWRSDTFNAMFERADVIVLESNGSDPDAQIKVQQAVQKFGLYSGDASLGSVLDESQRKEISAVATSLGAPMQAIDALKPWLASIQLGVLAVSKQGYDLNNGPGSVIEAEAKMANKPIQVFEGPTELLQRMAGFSEQEQIGMLLHTVRTLRDDPDQMARMNSAWLSGDVEAVADILHGDGGAWSSQAIYDSMLVERNAAWSTAIVTMMEQPGTIFVAVGLGHLAGKDSLVKMLSDKGFEVRRR